MAEYKRREWHNICRLWLNTSKESGEKYFSNDNDGPAVVISAGAKVMVTKYKYWDKSLEKYVEPESGPTYVLKVKYPDQGGDQGYVAENDYAVSGPAAQSGNVQDDVPF